MTAQLESQWLYDPAARTAGELRAEREEHAEKQIREAIAELHDLHLCERIKDTDALTTLLQKCMDGEAGPDAFEAFLDIAVPHWADLNEDEDALL